MADQKWYFTKDQLSSTPSSKCGYDADRELSCRQQAAHLIQDMGQRLQVSQLCINTAIVYMHRFYVFHSFTQFHLDAMAAAALFLAAKVEEMPRKLEHVIRVKQICLHRDQPQPALDVKSEQYLEQAQDLVFNENVLLQTLGFDVAIDHPHTHVVRCCHLVRASKDLAQTSYFMASNSLHLTTMCLQYKPTVVACFCIHLACKWSNWEIPQSNEGKYWFYYVDKTVTQDLLEQLTDEFLVIFEKCPSRLKKKIKSANQNASSYQFDKMPQRDSMHEGVSFQSHHRPQDPSKPTSSQLPPGQEKRERDRQLVSQSSHSQHRDGHHRSHHTGHPHPSSSSAVMKPHTGMPVHKIPHPGQHRSVSHHPRPDHHGRPDHPQRPDHPVRPADHQQRQERQSRPEHGVRPDHHARGEHPPRTEQVRPDQHQVRPDHQQRSDHPLRPDHQQRSDHLIRPEHQNRPDQQVRPDHTSRTDHPGSQVRVDHQQRLDSAARPDQVNRQDHLSRLEHQGPVERHDRLEGSERHPHPEQRYSGVTASRDQLRREAALQREATRRDIMHNLPSNIMMHSPAQRTTSGDSAISSSSSTSLTPSSQDGPGFSATSAVFGGASALASKHPGPSEPSHRHSLGYEKPKSSSSAIDSHMRHRNSLIERRQLESFFGKTGAQERINEKHQVKHVSSAPFKEVKKEPDTAQPQPTQASLVPSTLHVKREKVSPSRQQFNAVPQGRLDLDPTSSSMPGRHMNYKLAANEFTPARTIKTEPDAESEARNGTTVGGTLLIPKVEKTEVDVKETLVSSRLPPVKGSIFSPEKTLPKERESSLSQRTVKSNCPPSPGIVFGSPPVTPGKSQSSNNRNRTGNNSEPAQDLFKMERDTGYDNLFKNPNSNENVANKSLDSRLGSSLPKAESKSSHHLLKPTNYPIDHKALLYPPSSINSAAPSGRSNVSIVDDRQPVPSLDVSLNLAPAHSLVPTKGSDVRTAIPVAPIEGDLGAVAFPVSEAKDMVPVSQSDEGSAADHFHHKSKKKKEKKEKHKHKDKEKHREDKKHKSKHKEKDKERRKAEATPPHLAQSKPAITLKIPKKNLEPPPVPVVAAPPGGGLKLKISLAQISSASSSSSSKESRKRERDRSSPGPEGSHPKAPKLNTAVDAPKRSVGNAGHSSSSKSSYERQNGLESRGGRHMQHPQHYSGSKMVMDDGSSLKPSEISKDSSSHSSTS